METTPAKIQRTEGLGEVTSPQLAATAPCGAALPLPSSTTSPARCPDAKAAADRQKTPRSIRMWLSPSGASPSQVSPALRRILSPCSQSPASGPSTTERRAKRRLETGDAPSASCAAAAACSCVTELFPAAKKSRVPPGICCPAQASSEQTERCSEERQSPSCQAGKENCCPTVTDWLSVMGQKMRGQGSPRSPRSPSASKRQDSKRPASPVSPL